MTQGGTSLRSLCLVGVLMSQEEIDMSTPASRVSSRFQKELVFLSGGTCILGQQYAYSLR